MYNDSSPYFENINIDKSISLIGNNKDTTIIDGNRNGDVVSVTVDLVNISGFTIQNASLVAPYMGAGIWIYSNYTTIEGNIILNSTDGIRTDGHVDKSNKNNIVGNIISNNSYGGISLRYSLSNIISLNTIIHNGEGIYLHNSNYSSIINNTLISNNQSGILLSSSHKNNITRNNILENGEGIGLIGSNNNTITNNKIKSNNDSGLWFLGGQYNVICNNTILKTLDGIHLQVSYNNMVKNNFISNNKCGIFLHQSYRNNIQKNNFLDNERDVDFLNIFLDNLKMKNIWKENYWNRTWLFPKPIFGKIAILLINYRAIIIPWINIDWHPALKPYDI